MIATKVNETSTPANRLYMKDESTCARRLNFEYRLNTGYKSAYVEKKEPR